MRTKPQIIQASWQMVGPILPGGTIYALTLSPNKEQGNPLVVGTPVGVFRSLTRGQKWALANRGLASLRVSALASSPNGVLFVGTQDGHVGRSVDGGYSWLCFGPLEGAGSVTALAVSPDYLKDGTVLIATENSGVFRSTDSCRTCKPANFGLSDLTVLSIACAPGWPTKQVAFAGTTDGLFRSTNGGRAWRRCGPELEGLSVQCLAVSPNFLKDGVVVVGTEEDGLFISDDGGNSFVAVASELIPDNTINAVWISPSFARDGLILVGTAGHGLFRSTDRGKSWQQVLHSAHACLALGGDAESIFAGFHQAGVYRSDDGGHSWQQCVEGLYGHAFTQLVRPAGAPAFAGAPDLGIYTSADGGGWMPLPSMPEVAGLAAFAVTPDYAKRPLIALAGSEGQVHVSADGGSSWKQAYAGAASAIAIGAGAEHPIIMVGTLDGEFARSDDGGDSWHKSTPFGKQAVLRLELSPSFASDGVVAAATRLLGDPSAPIVLWRSRDGGRTWSELTSEEVRLSHVSLAIDPEGGTILAALDRYLLIEGSDGSLERVSFPPDEPAVLSIALLGGGAQRTILAGTAEGAYAKHGEAPWQPLVNGMGLVPVLSFAPVYAAQPGSVWALTLGGIIWALP